MNNQDLVRSDGQLTSQRSMVAQDNLRESTDVVDSVQNDHSDAFNYVGSTHWSTILDDLHDLKAFLRTSPDTQDGEHEIPTRAPHVGNEPIFGAFSSFSLDQIISEYLPAKVEIDRLVSHYFQGPVIIIPFLQTYQFQRQYRDFWDDTTEVNPLWLSILFSICYMSFQVRKVTEPVGPPLKEPFTGNSFLHIAAGHCLVLGTYHQPQVFAVEALAMYAQSKHFQTLDPSREAGIILSVAVRTAYHLGYHRDPDLSGSLTVFEGEMRRRC